MRRKPRQPAKQVFAYLTDTAAVSLLAGKENINKCVTNALLRRMGKSPVCAPRKADSQGRLWVRVTNPECVDYILKRKREEGVLPKYTIAAAVKEMAR